MLTRYPIIYFFIHLIEEIVFQFYIVIQNLYLYYYTNINSKSSIVFYCWQHRLFCQYDVLVFLKEKKGSNRQLFDRNNTESCHLQVTTNLLL